MTPPSIAPQSRFSTYLRALNAPGVLPALFVATALPTVLWLCFLTPPMQARDEGQHFLRSCQIAKGHFLSQADPATGALGGVLPAAESDFVNETMTPSFLRQEDGLRTVSARMAALERSAQLQTPLENEKFVPIRMDAIYPPALYLPQVLGIRLAAIFSDKVFVLFYAARVVNAVTAVLLIAAALYLAPSYQYLLLLPAVLPMSLYQFGSVSTDAGVISLSILFVALCLRFEERDSPRLRTALFFSLLLLALGKPAYLPAAPLLLGSWGRLGKRRSLRFFVLTALVPLVSYLAWSYVSRKALTTPLHASLSDPTAQVRELIAHPSVIMSALLATVKNQSVTLWSDVVGFLGWFSLPMPTWFYLATLAFCLAITVCVVANLRTFEGSRVALAGLAGVGIVAAVCLAAYILWQPLGSRGLGLQGRYFIPVAITSVFAAPPMVKFGPRSARCVRALSIAFFLFSAFWTVRMVSHYYFPISVNIGRNVHDGFALAPETDCPASIDYYWPNQFSFVEDGSAASRDPGRRVVLTDDTGTILGESDPVLVGYNPNAWRVNVWTPEKAGRVDSWLIQGSMACWLGWIEVSPPELHAD